MEKTTILYYQNIVCFVICSILVSNLVWANYYGTYKNVSIPLIMGYFVFDIGLVSMEMKFHHILVLSTYASIYCNKIHLDDVWILTNECYKMEISTIFYTIKYWVSDADTENRLLTYVPKKTLGIFKNVIDLAFFATFFKYRICDFYNNIVTNPVFYNIIYKYIQNDLIKNVHFYTSVYLFYALNVYWFCIMCKIAFKPIVRSLSIKTLTILEHKITSILQIVTLGISSWIYLQSPKKSFILDLIGILNLSYASYHHHQAVAKYYNTNNKIIYTSKELLFYFLYDQFAIHVRSALCCATAIYYNNTPILIFISGSLHTISFILTILKIKDVPNDKLEEYNNHLVKYVNVATIIPITFDIFTIIYSCNDYMTKVNGSYISFISVVILLVVPFYELNHVEFNICTVLQGFYAANCNVNVCK